MSLKLDKLCIRASTLYISPWTLIKLKKKPKRNCCWVFIHPAKAPEIWDLGSCGAFLFLNRQIMHLWLSHAGFSIGQNLIPCCWDLDCYVNYITSCLTISDWIRGGFKVNTNILLRSTSGLKILCHGVIILNQLLKNSPQNCGFCHVKIRGLGLWLGHPRFDWSCLSSSPNPDPSLPCSNSAYCGN